MDGFEYLDELDLDALLKFRSTWKDEALAKQFFLNNVLSSIQPLTLIRKPGWFVGLSSCLHCVNRVKS